MLVSQLKIENFRGIKSANINFDKHTVLIGGNNCGKTTVVEALTLLLGRDKMIRTLTEHDFYGSEPKITDRIKLIATITEFPYNLPEENPTWFGDGRAIPKWISSTSGEVVPTPEDDKAPLACQIAFAARFDFNSLEVDTIRYFYDDDNIEDVFDEELHVRLPQRVVKELGYFIVPASRSWDKVISFGSELFRRVINSGGGKPSKSVIDLRDTLRKPNSPIEEDINLAPLIKDINDELGVFFTSKPKLELKITSTDSESILDAVIPHFVQNEMGSSLPSRRQGSGLISLQWLLLLLQFGRQRSKAGEGFIMSLEEPELHIPPSIQSKLVHRIQALSTQTFITTHSPTIAAISNPTSLVILNNSNGSLSANRFLKEPISSATPNSIRSLFQINRSETVSALMHEFVLIPEGRIDFELLNMLIKVVELTQSWDNSGDITANISIGIIPTHDAAIKTTFDYIMEMHPNVHCIVDGDAPGKGYAAEIEKVNNKNTKVFRWGDNCTIEDMVGWILKADESRSLKVLSETLNFQVGSIEHLITCFKNKDRNSNGLKGDRLAYESMFQAIYESKECYERTKLLINNMCKVMRSESAELFPRCSTSSSVFVFHS